MQNIFTIIIIIIYQKTAPDKYKKSLIIIISDGFSALWSNSKSSLESFVSWVEVLNRGAVKKLLKAYQILASEDWGNRWIKMSLPEIHYCSWGEVVG